MNRLYIGAAIALTALSCVNCLNAQSALALSSGSAPSGTPVSMTLTLSSNVASQPAGLQWTFTYPAASVSSFVVTTGAGLSSASKTLSCASTAAGYICLATGINTFLISDGPIAKVSALLAPGVSSVTVGVSNPIAVSLDGSVISASATGNTAMAADTTAPSVPSNVVSVPTSSTVISVSWAPSTDNVGVAGYKVYRNGALVTTVTSGSSYVDSGLAPATTYSYTVCAFDAAGNVSPQSAPASATTPGPPVIGTFSAAPASIVPGGTATLSWTVSGATTLAIDQSIGSVTGKSSTTVSPATTTTYTLTATNASGSATAKTTVTVNPLPTISSITCNPLSLRSAGTATCTATISQTTPVDVVLSLAASPAGTLSVSSTATVRLGANSTSFVVTAGTIAASLTGSVTATLNGSSLSTTLSLSPDVLAPRSVTCLASTLTPNQSTTCTVRLNQGAPAAGTTILLSTSLPSLLSVPSSITVPGGALSTDFLAAAGTISSGQNAMIRAQVGPTAVSFTVALSPAASSLAQLACSPLTLAPGANGSCTVTLTQASSTAATVTLRSTNASISVPVSVVVPAGSVTAGFGFTVATSWTGWAIVSANMGTVTKTVTITAALSPGSNASLAASIVGLRCVDPSIQAGQRVVCEVAYRRGTSDQEVEFALSSTSPRLKVPSSIQARGKRGFARFEVYADEDAINESATVHVTLASTHAETSVSLIAPGSLHLSVPERKTTSPGAHIQIPVRAFDDTGNRVAARVSNSPKGAQFNSMTGMFEWTPSESDMGQHAVSFAIENSVGVTVTRTVIVSVVPSRPHLETLRSVAGSEQSGCSPGTLMALEGTFLDDSTAPETGRLLVNGNPAVIADATSEQLRFVCPVLAAGTLLRIVREVGHQRSNELSTVMLEAAPQLFTIDGTDRALALHSSGLAALPRFDRIAMPAAAGDEVTFWATGINCVENIASRLTLHIGHDYQQIRLRPSALAGVCELHATVPAGVSGDDVEVFLESVRNDGMPVRSNRTLIAVDE
jgi:hypothetical protein